MFKRSSIILLIFVLLLSSLLLLSCQKKDDDTDAYDPLATPEPTLSFTLLENGTWSVAVGGFNNKKEIVIPAEHEGRAVTEIAESGFAGALAEKITVPNSIVAIGADAFKGCIKLTALTLPDAVSEISSGAFADCIYLESFTFPSATTTIGAEAFKNCTALTAITVPEGILAIGDSAFYGCTQLTSITLPSTLQTVGANAFAVNGEQLLEEPYTLQYNILEDNLYLGNPQNPRLVLIKCNSTDSTFNLHADTHIIYDSAFAALPLTAITLHENVSDLGVYAFSQCENLTSIYIPAGVKTICTGTFYPCRALHTIEGMTGVESIEDNAFAYCRSLTGITLGNNVTAIGEGVFNGTSSLQATTYRNISYIGSAENPYLLLYRVTDKSESSYLLHADTKIIYPSAFSNCRVVENIELPLGLTCIGKSAFSGCSNLFSFTIPDTVTLIGERAFYKCTRFYTAIIPQSVTHIGSSAFEGCNNISSITIPFVGESADGTGRHIFGHIFGAKNTSDHLTKIPEKLKTVTITGGTSIGASAFSHCKNLETVKLPASLKVINAAAFFMDKNIKQVYISDLSAWCGVQVATADANPLTYGATLILKGKKITDLIIPDTVTEICPFTFNGCKSITSVSMGESVTKIGNGAFENCTSLKEATLGDGVTVLRPSAFQNCESLESITLSDSLSEIGSSAFRGCKTLERISLPASLTRIDDRAFKGCDNLTRVRFARKLGWFVSQKINKKGDFILPMRATRNATKLTEDYVDSYWVRG